MAKITTTPISQRYWTLLTKEKLCTLTRVRKLINIHDEHVSVNGCFHPGSMIKRTIFGHKVHIVNAKLPPNLLNSITR